MNKKLRLLVTDKCNRNCAMCCNKGFDLKSLKVVSRWTYDEIMLTGGEPMLFPNKAVILTKYIKTELAKKKSKKQPKIYLCTAVSNWMHWSHILPYVDGLVLTLHEQKDVEDFTDLQVYLTCFAEIEGKSLRLNVFEGITLPDNIGLSNWQVKSMTWQKDCPVPKGEDFRRIENLW